MKINLYQATVPPCIRALTNLNAILDKAAAHARARKIEESVLINTRLFPDMFPLAMQVVVACDVARGGAARLACAPVPAYEPKSASFDELIANTRNAIASLEALKESQFEGGEDRTITWQTRSSTKNMQGLPYLTTHVLPNLYFHVTTAYDILRQSGLELGKMDYLGKT